MEAPARGLPSLATLAKAVICLLVLAYVGRHAWQMWQQAGQTATINRLHWGWLAAAAGCYGACWLPSVWFWRQLLAAAGDRPSLGVAIRAYYVGHLGKYVPGKAMVLVIRGERLKAAGHSPWLAIVTAGYETLATMGAGLAWAVALAPLAFGASLWEQAPGPLRAIREAPWLTFAGVWLIVIICLPVLARLCTLVTRKAFSRRKPAGGQEPTSELKFSTRLLAEGLAVVSIGWFLHAAALMCVVAAVTGDWPEAGLGLRFLAIVTLATVGGFVVFFAPGGLGPREWLMLEALRSQGLWTDPQIVLSVLMMRVVSFVTELLLAGLFSWNQRQPDSGDTRRPAP